MRRIALAIGLMSVLVCGPGTASALPIDAGLTTLVHGDAPVTEVFFRGGGRRFAGRGFAGRRFAGRRFGARRYGYRGRRYGYGRRGLGVAAGVAGAAVVGGAVAAGAASGCRRYYNPNTGAYATNC